MSQETISNPRNLHFVFGGDYVVTDEVKFAKLTIEDAKRFGEIEHNALRRQWKQSGRKLRWIGEFERFTAEFGIRAAQPWDSQPETPFTTDEQRRRAIAIKTGRPL